MKRAILTFFFAALASLPIHVFADVEEVIPGVGTRQLKSGAELQIQSSPLKAKDLDPAGVEAIRKHIAERSEILEKVGIRDWKATDIQVRDGKSHDRILEIRGHYTDSSHAEVQFVELYLANAKSARLLLITGKNAISKADLQEAQALK